MLSVILALNVGKVFSFVGNLPIFEVISTKLRLDPVSNKQIVFFNRLFLPQYTRVPNNNLN